MQKVLVILGPTTSGKSVLAVKLAKKFNGEVISADSRQVYKGLDIGTGKITEKEMRGVPHHLLDIADPRKQFTVVQYVEKASHAIEAIAWRNKLPIVVGGTGFYIQTLVDGVVLPDVPPNKKLRARLSKKTASELSMMLQRLDPSRAKNIDQRNPRRLIRAIEITSALGKVPNLEARPPSKGVYKTLIVGLTLPPEKLRKIIAARLRSRINLGMIAEAKRLHRQGLSWKRMGELGLEYRYLSMHLKNEISKIKMVEKLKTEIWRYAKRQMTWFKRDERIKWFSPSDTKQIEKSVRNFLK